MKFGNRIAVISDIHGEHRVLSSVLESCRNADVHAIVLLGDLFDRIEQAQCCFDALSSWPTAGVLGNHELEALRHSSTAASVSALPSLIKNLEVEFRLDDALFIHDALDLHHYQRSSHSDDHSPERVVFAGHTHYRSARDERGPIDISLGRIHLRDDRRYVINPGAVVDGQFAIWDRQESLVMFERV
jgi:predicted phosphodiesterase